MPHLFTGKRLNKPTPTCTAALGGESTSTKLHLPSQRYCSDACEVGLQPKPASRQAARHRHLVTRASNRSIGTIVGFDRSRCLWPESCPQLASLRHLLHDVDSSQQLPFRIKLRDPRINTRKRVIRHDLDCRGDEMRC